MDAKVMQKIGYGLYVLTVRDGERDNGCIINTLIQITSTPQRVSITVNKANYTHEVLMRTGIFNVSIISQEADFGLFKRFGFASGRDTDKFVGFDHVLRTGNDLLAVTGACNSWLSGRVFHSIDLGTHTMFLADVTDAAVLSPAETATYAYYHSSIKPKPEDKASGGWRCKICGYVYEGDELPDDFVCPICKHGRDDFERI
ncbi:MAG: flavin reductase [Candidatus Heteroscillospira sp.]|jgi:flavin reductase (DIM6/NTAB) family NADH-FMN oxidoreductase RutF